MKKPSALIFYHFYHPDDVVSAQQFKGLAEGLVARGWDVEVMPSNRSRRDNFATFQKFEWCNGVKISRVWRPAFNQSHGKARISNALWMISFWGMAAVNIFRRSPDVVVVGTDPILGVLTAIPWKILRPRTRFVHWCFDLYPETAVIDGIIPAGGFFETMVRKLCGFAYQRCDLIVDIGSCMRSRLEQYPTHAKRVTIPPWALDEPDSHLLPDSVEREQIMGTAQLGLMYSGSLGRAHVYLDILSLARSMSAESVKVVFSVTGTFVSALNVAIEPDDTNIEFVDFAPLDKLRKRLSVADIHIVSLKEEWTGMVVPSKFFGALAVGRPVLFVGSSESAIAQWIQTLGVGWVLSEGNQNQVRSELLSILEDPQRLEMMFKHCYTIYQSHFSKSHAQDIWDHQLRGLLVDK